MAQIRDLLNPVEETSQEHTSPDSLSAGAYLENIEIIDDVHDMFNDAEVKIEGTWASK